MGSIEGGEGWKPDVAQTGESQDTVAENGFEVYDMEGRSRRGSVDSLGSISIRRTDSEGLGMGVPMDRQPTLRFVDPVRASTAPGGILVLPTPAMDGEEEAVRELSFRVPRPRSVAGYPMEDVAGEGEDLGGTMLGAGIPYQRYHSRAISFDIPDRNSGTPGGRARSVSRSRRGSRSEAADHEHTTPSPELPSIARLPKFKRSLSLGGEITRSGLGGSGTWSPRQFFRDLGDRFRPRSTPPDHEAHAMEPPTPAESPSPSPASEGPSQADGGSPVITPASNDPELQLRAPSAVRGEPVPILVTRATSDDLRRLEE